MFSGFVPSLFFFAWVERLLKIDDLQKDLGDGVMLINLFELISEHKFKRYNKKPRMKIQKLENLNMVLSFVESQKVKLVNVGAEDIEEGRLKIILGLLWSTILRFSISGGDADSSPKRALLDWINKQIKPYEKNGIEQVNNFTSDWKDGKVYILKEQQTKLCEYIEIV